MPLWADVPLKPESGRRAALLSQVDMRFFAGQHLNKKQVSFHLHVGNCRLLPWLPSSTPEGQKDSLKPLTSRVWTVWKITKLDEASGNLIHGSCDQPPGVSGVGTFCWTPAGHVVLCVSGEPGPSLSPRWARCSRSACCFTPLRFGAGRRQRPSWTVRGTPTSR